MLGVQTAEDGLARIIHGKKSLGKAPNPMVVMYLRQMSPHNLAPRERVQEPVPQQDVLRAELTNVAVGAQQEVLLVVEAARGFRQEFKARARIGERGEVGGGALKVGEEGEKVVRAGLECFKGLQQDGAHLLQ